jgi:superfamily II DNA/RNA helicase
VLVATPGRLGDLIKRRTCVLDEVEITVLDEADQMADMGFLPEVTDLLSQTPEGGQRLLFSATLDRDVDSLVRRFLKDPVTHSIGPNSPSIDSMDHHMLLVPPHDKFAVAASIAARTGRSIFFVKTQAAVDQLVGQLAEVGVRAGALHGGKTQRVRTRTLAEFREGAVDVLVATDVAARGIHVDGVSLVVHVDLPRDQKDYLHRAGRTARAGAAGTVVTLVLPRQRARVAAMLAKAGVKPQELRVRAGDPALAEVTGAREPSGVPVRVPSAEAPHSRGPKRYDNGPMRHDDGPKRHDDRRPGGGRGRPRNDDVKFAGSRRPPRQRPQMAG